MHVHMLDMKRLMEYIIILFKIRGDPIGQIKAIGELKLVRTYMDRKHGVYMEQKQKKDY